MEYNIYCDESCHLENDRQKVMALGAVWCPKKKVRSINDEIREIKKKHGISRGLEAKWTKVSPGKIDFYCELISYFFKNKDLHFRIIVIPDKTKLCHEEFDQDHNTWYYKMYFDMLKVIFKPNCGYNIFVDIKDTIGGEKISKLQEILCYNQFDFDRQIVKKIQLVRSHEIEIMQLTDLLIGATVYANRKEFNSQAKMQLIDYIQEQSQYALTRSTLYQERKFNILIWNATEIH